MKVRRYEKYIESGDDWIGEIPIEWGYAKLAWRVNFINGYAFNSDNLDIENEIPVIRIGDIQNNQVSYNTCLKVKSNKELERYTPRRNDIVIAMSGATTGKLAVINSDEIS